MSPAIHKKIFASSFKTLMFSSKETNDIRKIVKSLKELGLLIKGSKEQKEGYIRMLLKRLGASLLGYLLVVKGTVRADGIF